MAANVSAVRRFHHDIAVDTVETPECARAVILEAAAEDTVPVRPESRGNRVPLKSPARSPFEAKRDRGSSADRGAVGRWKSFTHWAIFDLELQIPQTQMSE